MINPINKKGYSFIELILGVVILSVISISSIGIYSANTGNLDEATTGVVSKLEYTQEFAKVRDTTTVVDVPHIELTKKKMNSIVEQNGVNYQYKDTPYINNLTNNIEVTTNLNNNKLYFSSQGYPIDENGKLLEDVRIYVTKKVLGVETKVYTITIDCTGNIEIIKSKDTSQKRTCSLADRAEALENIKVCDEGQELYNGSCVESCNYDQKRVNGVCEDICPSGQVYSSDGTCKGLCNPTFIVNPTTKQCECASGYEPFNGACVEKCKANETRNSTGTCVCIEGYGRKNGVCVKLTESEKYGCVDQDKDNPPLIRTQIQVDDNFHAYLSKSPTDKGVDWDYHQNWNHGLYSSMTAMQLEETADVYYLHIDAWNYNGSENILGPHSQAEAVVTVAVNKPYYVFDNGKNYIDSHDADFFNVSRIGFGGPKHDIVKGDSDSGYAFWTNDSPLGHIYITLRLSHIKKGDKCSY